MNKIKDIKSNSKSRFCIVNGFEFKTLDDGLKVPQGYIATTHLDSGFFDASKGAYIRDKIDVSTLNSWADEINAGNPRANKMSVNHNRVPHVAGRMTEGTARVDILSDGEYGLFVQTPTDKTREDSESIDSRIDNRFLDSYSIEFTTKNPVTGEYYSNAVNEVERDGYIERTLLPGTFLEGATYASQPMNENAVMMKEIQMSKEQGMEDISKMESKTEVKEKIETKEVIAEPVKVEAKMSQSDADLIAFAKETKQKQADDKAKLEMKESIMAEVKSSLLTAKVETKAQNTGAGSENVETKEFVEYKSMFKPESKLTIKSQLKIAGKMAEELGLFKGEMKSVKPINRTLSGGYKLDMVDLSTKSKYTQGIEMKGLGITTNQNTDTDYLLSTAELSDVFDPIINNILNQKTTTWNILTKEDWSGRNSNNITFKLKIAANSTAGAYTGNAVNLGNVNRIKYQTKMKKYSVGFEIDGDLDAVSDAVQMEVSDGADDLMSVINLALYSEVGLETAAGVIGFEYITDQAGNTTLYNEPRTQANGLASTTTADNYINGASADLSITNLRAAKRKSVGTEGADLNQVVFFGSFVQGDKLRSIYDSAQRLIPTSSRFGFEGMMSFDSIPFFEDKDCNDDDVFLIDLATHKIGIFVPPTVIMLGIDSDSTKGFIKTYFATYNSAPRRSVQIYGNATA